MSSADLRRVRQEVRQLTPPPVLGGHMYLGSIVPRDDDDEEGEEADHAHTKKRGRPALQTALKWVYVYNNVCALFSFPAED